MWTAALVLGMLMAQAPGVDGPEAVPKAPRPIESARLVQRPVSPPPYTPPARPPSQPFPVWLFAWLAMLPAIYAAQRQQKQRREEEEAKTPYAEEDLMNDWEFKILRDPLGRFGRENFRMRILQEESAAGWQLVEVFDAARLRLKRPPSARETPAALPVGHDPYWLALRMPSGYVLNIILGILCAIAAGGFGIFALVNAIVPSPPGLSPLLAMGALLGTAGAVICFVLARRKARA